MLVLCGISVLYLPLHLNSNRLQDSLEFIGQDSNTPKPDHNSGANSLLGNIGKW